MKIAISSQGQTLDSQIDPRFGRAAYFLIIDSLDDNIKVIDNSLNVKCSTVFSDNERERDEW